MWLYFDTETRAFNNRYDAQNYVIFKDQIQKKKKRKIIWILGKISRDWFEIKKIKKKQSLRLYVINVATLPFIGVVIIHWRINIIGYIVYYLKFYF